MAWSPTQPKKHENRKSSGGGGWRWQGSGGGGRVDKIWKMEGEVGNIGGGGGLHKIRRLAPFCELCKETLKISHPPIIKPTPPSIPGFPHISCKNFPSTYPITAIFEKFHPPRSPFMKGWEVGLCLRPCEQREVTWEFEKLIFPLPQYWSPVNLAGC